MTRGARRGALTSLGAAVVALLRRRRPAARPARRIGGAPLLGFAEAFEGAYGDPQTPVPYVRLAPLRMGDALLPFPCPRCASPVGPTAWAECADRRGGYSWCPACLWRFKLDRRGTPVLDRRGAEVAAVSLAPAGASAVTWAPAPPAGALSLLGADPI